MAKMTGLGKGLDALFGPAPEEEQIKEPGNVVEDESNTVQVKAINPEDTPKIRFNDKDYYLHDVKAGETLEVNVVMVDNPSLEVKFNGNTEAVFGTGSGVPMAYWTQAAGVPVKMNAGAPVQEPPAEPDIEVMPVPDAYVAAREEYLSHSSPETREDDRRQYRKVSLFSEPPGAVPGPLDSEQYLLSELLESGAFERHLNRIRRRLRGNEM